MYCVLLVDDEPIICEGLSSVVDWAKYDCRICGIGSSAADGLEKIKEYRPDIIITDIKMGNMSGLDMLHEAEEYIKNSRIIIITGHRDFDYAAEAIELGVSAFLLKPLNLTELERAMRRAVSFLDNLHKSGSKSVSDAPLPAERFFHDAAYGIITDRGRIYESLSAFGIQPNEYAVVSLKCDGGASGDFESDVKSYFVNFAKGYASVYMLAPNANNYISLIIISDTPVIDRQMLISNLADVQSVMNVSFSIGISSVSNDYTQLSHKLRESARALIHKHYTGNKSIVSYDDSKIFFESSFARSNIDKLQQRLLDIISAGAAEELPACINEIVASLAEMPAEDMKRKCYDTIRCIFSINNSLENSFCNFDSVRFVIDNSADSRDFAYLIRLISTEMVRKVNIYNSGRLSAKLQKAIEYINNNYDKYITLSNVSDAVGLSPNYVSSIFKKELGKRFSDYVTETKIEYAKKFLKNHEYKIYEISNLVGISDGLYFSKLFKKHVGMSPSEYRGKYE